MEGHAKRYYQMDRRMIDLSENQVARGSNLAGRNRASSLSFGSLGLAIGGYIGPLPEDENGFAFIVVIVENSFSKFMGLHPARRTTSKDVINAYLQWVGIFGVPKEIRSDGWSQFTSKLS